jgi:hypothetical protein
MQKNSRLIEVKYLEDEKVDVTGRYPRSVNSSFNHPKRACYLNCYMDGSSNYVTIPGNTTGAYFDSDGYCPAFYGFGKAWITRLDVPMDQAWADTRYEEVFDPVYFFYTVKITTASDPYRDLWISSIQPFDEPPLAEDLMDKIMERVRVSVEARGFQVYDYCFVALNKLEGVR